MKKAALIFLVLFWMYCLIAESALAIIRLYRVHQFAQRCEIMCFDRKCPDECRVNEEQEYVHESDPVCDGRGCY